MGIDIPGRPGSLSLTRSGPRRIEGRLQVGARAYRLAESRS